MLQIQRSRSSYFCAAQSCLAAAGAVSTAVGFRMIISVFGFEGLRHDNTHDATAAVIRSSTLDSQSTPIHTTHRIKFLSLLLKKLQWGRALYLHSAVKNGRWPCCGSTSVVSHPVITT